MIREISSQLLPVMFRSSSTSNDSVLLNLWLYSAVVQNLRVSLLLFQDRTNPNESICIFLVGSFEQVDLLYSPYSFFCLNLDGNTMDWHVSIQFLNFDSCIEEEWWAAYGMWSPALPLRGYGHPWWDRQARSEAWDVGSCQEIWARTKGIPEGEATRGANFSIRLHGPYQHQSKSWALAGPQGRSWFSAEQ